MPVVNYKPTVYSVVDPSNRDIQARTASSHASLSYFGQLGYVTRAAERMLKSQAYPLAQISFEVNRSAFRLRPGDLFRLDYQPWGLTGMVCRVLQVEEGAPDSETLTITAAEAVEYLAGELDASGYWDDAGQGEGPAGKAEPEEDYLAPLDRVRVLEAPWIVAGGQVAAVVAAGRELGREIGYNVYVSLAGDSYGFNRAQPYYSVHGQTTTAYPDDTHAIDDRVGLEIECDNRDVDLIGNLDRARLLVGGNLALLGDELIGFQTAEPVGDLGLRLTGVVRGLYDTRPQDHPVGTDFYFIGPGYYALVQSTQFLVGQTRYFKATPYSETKIGAVADAAVHSLSFEGRVHKPLVPTGFQCNLGGRWSAYTTGTDNLALSWSGRIRDGVGAGLLDEGQADQAPTWEGIFEVEVWDPDPAGTRVAHVDHVDALDRVLTVAASGTLTARLRNKIEVGGRDYASDWTSITIRRTS